MITIKDIYWLAGYLEGEGCFTISISNTKGGSKTHRIIVSCEDKDITEKASILLVGYVRLSSNKQRHNPKQYYGTSVAGPRAIAWMMTLYPLMSIRRKKRIREVIADWKIYTKNYSMTSRAILTRKARGIKKIPKVKQEFKPFVNPFEK